MRILGIDPGLRHTGWGILDKHGSKFTLIACGTIDPDPALPMPQRLTFLFKELSHVIEKHTPTTAALEETFVNQNPRSALKLGFARGIVFMTPGYYDLEVHEYSPTQVKKGLVGSGHASKEQIITMVKMILNIQGAIKPDVADALAVAITHAHHRESHQLRGLA